MKPTFRIDCSPESALAYGQGFAAVAVDVIRATTTAVTAASLGWKCYPVGSLEGALRLASELRDPLLAGELHGEKPDGFHINNSPVELAEIQHASRPLVLLSSAGTKLIVNAAACDVVYLACFRNAACTADQMIQEAYPKIALLGAGTRGEFREEDQIACAWIAARLQQAGYVAENAATAEIMNRWRDAPATDCLQSRSVDYLKRTNQMKDLQFILDRINDLQECFTIKVPGPVTRRGGELQVTNDLSHLGLPLAMG
jgi:2-phosphosulfolactate phosphatase